MWFVVAGTIELREYLSRTHRIVHSEIIITYKTDISSNRKKDSKVNFNHLHCLISLSLITFSPVILAAFGFRLESLSVVKLNEVH